MHIEAHDHLGRPVKIPVTRVVVFDDKGNPVMFAMQQQPGHITLGRVEDEDFNDNLHMLGIDKTVIVETLDPRRRG